MFFLTQGFLGGILLASLVLWFIHSTMPKVVHLRDPERRGQIELIGLASAAILFFLVFTTGQPAIDWIQRAIGIISGVAFRNWVEVTLRDFISETKQNKNVNLPIPAGGMEGKPVNGDGLLQWPPWRNLLLILVLLITGLLVPRLEPWLKQINRIKAGDVEIELAQKIQGQKKLTMERERLATASQQVPSFTVWIQNMQMRRAAF